MKTARINGIILLCALLPMLAALAGCVDKTPATPDPVISVADPSPIAPEGGTFELAVNVTNPVEGVTLEAVCSETWLHIESVTDGRMTAEVEANGSATERTAEITFTYEGAEPVNVTALQYGTSVPFVLTPGAAYYDTLSVHVTPADPEMTYLVMAQPSDEFAADSAEEWTIGYVENLADINGMTFADVLSLYSYQGEQDAAVYGLYPNTEHTVYVYSPDASGNALTDIFTCTMETLPVPDGQPSGCTIDITVSGVTDNSAAVTFRPSDESVYYYYEVFDEAGYGEVSQDWNAYIYNYMTSRVIHPLTLEETIRVICAYGEYTQYASGLTEETRHYACAVGVDMTALTITDVTVEEFTTTEFMEIDYTLDFSVKDVTSRTAVITAQARDSRAFYYWNVMTSEQYLELGGDEETISRWFLDMMNERRIEQYGEYAYLISLPDYIYMQCTRGAEPDEYSFTSLTGDTEYYVYGFWIDETTGEKASASSFSEPFTTPEVVTSSATVTAEAILTDGDDWRELNLMAFGHYGGYAILGAELTYSDNAVKWYSNIYDISQLSFSDDELITSLLQQGYYNKDRYHLSYGAEWDKEYVILSVAVDADGNVGELHKCRFTATKDDALPIDSIPELFPEDFEM